jgi:hypothetical protein
MARDIVHDVVKKALQKEGWQITKELFSIEVGEVRMEIDLTHYPILIKRVLKDHAQPSSYSNSLEIQTLFNDSQHDYQLLCIGWHDDDRIHRCLIHIQIKDRKIWIEQDETEVGIANELVEAGVPKADIVLAYQAPYLRHMTEFAPG